MGMDDYGYNKLFKRKRVSRSIYEIISFLFEQSKTEKVNAKRKRCCPQRLNDREAMRAWCKNICPKQV